MLKMNFNFNLRKGGEKVVERGWIGIKLGKEGKKMIKFLSLFVALMLAAVPARAARPLTTDDAGIVDIGKWEIESGYTITNPRGGGAATSSLGLQIKRGMFTNFDFAVEIPYQLTSPSGLQDAILHGKYKLLGDEETGWTVRGDIKLTNGDVNQGLGSGYMDCTILLINTSKLGIFPIHTDLCYCFKGVAPGSPSANFTQASVAGEYSVDKFNFVSEVIWNNSADPNPLTALLGGYYQIIEGLRADLGATFGLNDSAPQNVVTFGLTKEL